MANGFTYVYIRTCTYIFVILAGFEYIHKHWVYIHLVYKVFIAVDQEAVLAALRSTEACNPVLRAQSRATLAYYTG